MQFAGCGTEESEPWLSQTMPSVRPRACPTPAFIGYRRIANRSRRYRRATASAPGRPSSTKTSLRRPLLFALLPLALVVGGYFYVTGGTVMSTDNAYVQADMVGVSTDVSGLVSEVDVHDNQKVTKGEVLFKLDPLQFQLALDRANAQLASTGDDLRALQASYRNMQAQIDQAQKGRRLQHGQLSAPGAAHRQQLHAESHL